jgi:sarcosine oxidase
LLAERVVVTAGAWAADLVPELAARVSVARQHVGYFRLDAPDDQMAPPAFPVWVHLGAPGVGSHYGLPSFGHPGVKAAYHRTSHVSDDPEERAEPDAAELERVRAFLALQLTLPVAETLHAECCLYTNTPDEHFLLGELPGDPRIVVGSPCSGHGFKFGPLIGRLLAGLVTEGRTGVPEFDRVRATFALPGG